MIEETVAPNKRKLFGADVINTTRQIQFDIAKVLCLVDMVFVHCFEELGINDVSEGSAAQFVLVVVLDVLFGAGTFMACMGIGVAYTWKDNAAKFIKRGLALVGISYALNAVRNAIPYGLLTLSGHELGTEAVVEFLCPDILQFAGLALFLFGLLKRFKLSDFKILAVAIAMSIAGSFIQGFDTGHFVTNELLGIFVGTSDPTYDDAFACFPLLNWFIVVVAGYLYGNYLRRCTNLNKFHFISCPIATAILTTYMLIAIPNELGMMSGDLDCFYHMNTFNAAVVLTAAVSITGIYYFLAKGIPSIIKRLITRLSSNINSFYCIHWALVGWTEAILIYRGIDGLDDSQILAVGIGIVIVAAIAADIFRHHIRKHIKRHAIESKPANDAIALTDASSEKIIVEDKQAVAVERQI